MRTIKLIHPVTDDGYKHADKGSFELFPPASGLEVLAGMLDANCKELVAEIYNLKPIESLPLNADIVGVRDWFTNHKNSMELLKRAKSENPSCITVAGGPNASNLGRRILLNHPYVDYVVKGEGEESLVRIVEGRKDEEIPNIFYRRGSEIRFTYPSQISLDSLPLFNLEHHKGESLKGLDSRTDGYLEDAALVPLPVFSMRGCIKASKKGRCVYCTITDKGLRVMNPKRFWEQLVFLRERYGIKYFFVTDDDFVVGDFPSRLLKEKPKDLDVGLRVYANSANITPEAVNILKKLGVKEVYVGIEHIEEEILRNAGRIHRVDAIEEGIKLLMNNDIYASASFLFGLPGETKETATRNHEFSRRLYSTYPNVRRLLHSFVVPVIGSPLFAKLRSNPKVREEYKGNLAEDDGLDYHQLTELLIKNYCDVDFSYLASLIEDGKKMTDGRTSKFGGIEELR